ncbi:hypothetical protein J9253_08375 [Thiothrix litoralis]|uniref:Uncharacterized protein n=1 Tax=Thiothrix litoralis TaxID=2891210 RepID=A0ABX7WWA8_9GAMM|nr:hypothetical protein [Thiothrix litoralis]QTR47915.1 hypothetical protein J9253_08375 [Thiothrix litoralis]
MKKIHLAITLSLGVMAGVAYYASLDRGNETNALTTVTASAAVSNYHSMASSNMAVATTHEAEPEPALVNGYWPSDPNYKATVAETPDICKADAIPEDMRKTCEMEVYSASLQQQSVGELLSVWQATEANGDGKADIVNKLLAEKIQQLPDDDPMYDTLRNLTLNATDSTTLSGVAILLGEIGTAPVVGIAQAMIGQGLELEGYDVLRGLISTRSISQWDASRHQALSPIGDTLQSAWNNVQSVSTTASANDSSADVQRSLLASAIATEGGAVNAEFLFSHLNNDATDTKTRTSLGSIISTRLHDEGAIPVLNKYLNTSQPDSPAFQASAGALLGMAGTDAGAKELLKWSQAKATDADATMVKDWFSQSLGVVSGSYDKNVPAVNTFKPLAESGSFQSEAVKTAVLAGIAEQERQLQPPPSGQ